MLKSGFEPLLFPYTKNVFLCGSCSFVAVLTLDSLFNLHIISFVVDQRTSSSHPGVERTRTDVISYVDSPAMGM